MIHPKAVFSEGVALTLRSDGTYRVTDRATGRPIAGVRGLRLEPWDVAVFNDGTQVTHGQVIELDIESGNMRCYLTMEAETTGEGETS